MLQCCESLPISDGVLTGQYDKTDQWSVLPIFPYVRQMRLFIGDLVSGPLVWLYNSPPREIPLDDAERLRTPPHHHRSATFRLALGDQDQQFFFDRRWLGYGGYVLLEANRPYTDSSGNEGYKRFLIMDDRRGSPPIDKETESMDSAELIEHDVPILGEFGDGLSIAHTRDDQSVGTSSITVAEAVAAGGRSRGSLLDQSGWATLQDGSRYAAVFMGDPTEGSVLLMSKNAPDSVESPPGRYSSDVFRLVIEGSCIIGDRRYGPGEFVAANAGTPQGAVSHGSDGSLQLLYFADRRGWRPIDEKDRPLSSERLDEIALLFAS